MGYQVPRIELLDVIKATGLSEEFISVVDPLNLDEMKEAIQKALDVDGPYVIVTKRPCALIKEVIKKNAGKHCTIDAEKCKGCKSCMKIACPSLAFENKKAYVADPANCNACGLCMQMCKFDAITKVGE